MNGNAGNNSGRLSVADGGRAMDRRQRAEIELERTQRALFYAMRGKDGKSINKNMRNVARGEVKMLRTYLRRLKDAKAARNDAHNYPLVQQSVRALAEYADVLFLNDMRRAGETDAA